MRKFVSVGEDRYHILAEIPINPDITLKRLKIGYNADTILQNDETYYPARKMIDVEIDEIKVTTD
jgi:hypothetical protein